MRRCDYFFTPPRYGGGMIFPSTLHTANNFSIRLENERKVCGVIYVCEYAEELIDRVPASQAVTKVDSQNE